MVRPEGPVQGTVGLPGSKSLTNRYLVCAALADGASVLRGVSPGDDTRLMEQVLRGLGFDVQADRAAASMHIHGSGGWVPADSAVVDAGAAGTVMRFGSALVCLGRGEYVLDGTPRMRQRPIGQLVDALRALGAAVEYERVEGFPPLRVHARGLRGGEVSFERPVSSQFVSALLLAAPYAADDVMIRIDGELLSRPYVAMTVQTMRHMGVEVLCHEDRRFIVPAGQHYRGIAVSIEPDASAACYFWSAAAITGGRVRVAGLSLDSTQGDVRFVQVLEQMGCRTTAGPDGLEVAGPPPGQLQAIRIDMSELPDCVQPLAVTALFARGVTEIRHVAHLRLKETDRLEALGRELARLGARVDVRPDALRIEPPARAEPATIETYDDHRMAMSFALAGLGGAEVRIRNAGCVSKSFPEFFGVLADLCRAQPAVGGGRAGL